MTRNYSMFATPWKVHNEIWRWLAYARNRLVFAVYGIQWQRGWRLYGAPIIQKHRDSEMQFGPQLSLRSALRSNPLGPNHPVILTTWQAGACLHIGSRFSMTGGVVCAAESIHIGDRVTVGANCTIVDTDFHPLAPEQRQHCPAAGKTAPIVIEDDVFIGMNCLILKGVTIGTGSTIGAGSVVTKSIPPHVVAAGNPAHVIRKL